MSNPSNPPEISDDEAIRQVIADGGVMDYIDVVDAVQQKYRMKVSSALVEQVHMQMQKEAQSAPQTSADAEGPQLDHLAHALHFVKAVHGLQNAKKALADLEAVMQDLKD